MICGVGSDYGNLAIAKIKICFRKATDSLWLVGRVAPRAPRLWGDFLADYPVRKFILIITLDK
jgi:hypothetical protein